jgi:hypothetical protein
MLGLFVVTLINSLTNNTKVVDGVEESTQNLLGLILQLALGVMSGLGICLRVGFQCTFASILKTFIVFYGFLLGALSVAGENYEIPELAGLTGNENITTLGLVTGYIDIGLSVFGLIMTIAYHCFSSPSSSQAPYSRI